MINISVVPGMKRGYHPIVQPLHFSREKGLYEYVGFQPKHHCFRILVRAGMPILLESGSEFPLLYPQALNNRGEVAGGVIDGYVSGGNVLFTHQHAAVWSNGIVRRLAPITPDASTAASDINDSGVAVGVMYPVTLPWSEIYMAVLFRDGQIIPLGTLPGDRSSYAQAINNRGEILCNSWSSTDFDDRRSFLVRAGSIIDLGALADGAVVDAMALNNLGHIVGYAYDVEGRQRAFLYFDGAMHDLTEFVKPNTGWTFLSANAINDRGQIIGSGQINGGHHRAFLLTPKRAPRTKIPPRTPRGPFPGRPVQRGAR